MFLSLKKYQKIHWLKSPTFTGPPLERDTRESLFVTCIIVLLCLCYLHGCFLFVCVTCIIFPAPAKALGSSTSTTAPGVGGSRSAAEKYLNICRQLEIFEYLWGILARFEYQKHELTPGMKKRVT